MGRCQMRRREAVTKKKKKVEPLQCKPREPPTAAAVNHRNPKKGDDAHPHAWWAHMVWMHVCTTHRKAHGVHYVAPRTIAWGCLQALAK